MRFQPVYDIAELCAKKNITDAVLCPGSRCARLTLAFTRHPAIRTRTFSDERSAGFIAMGMAQVSNAPVAVICTSGTAVFNLAPSVAEAFFSETPLIILTADRPTEWIAQHDGQTLFQHGIFGKHVKRSFQLPQDYDHADSRWEINRIVNEAINLSRQEPRGPVHINAPFREPLYPEPDEKVTFSAGLRVIDDLESATVPGAEQRGFIADSWPSFNKVLVVAGQDCRTTPLSRSLSAFIAKHHVPFIADIIANQHMVEPAPIQHADLFLGQASDELKNSLKPDLLITFGQSLISKNVKIFLRKFSPRAHWHIQIGGIAADTFKNTTAVLHSTPESIFDFLTTLNPVSGATQKNHYRDHWASLEQRTNSCLVNFLGAGSIGELGIVNAVIEGLPAECNLHLANSMSVRHANLVGLSAAQQGVRVFPNRGTSGIDGCTSTSVGQHLASGKPTFLITGDLAFFYDRNAFWHNYALPGLRILLLNNHGGLIFNMIDGPASVPEAKEYFITRQSLNARKLCEEFQFDHLNVNDAGDVQKSLREFFKFDGRTKILEFESDVDANRSIFDRLKQKIKSEL